MSEKKNDIRVLYLHGRPQPHPLHGAFAKAVNGVFRFIDPYMRWQDKNRSLLYRIISSFVNACMFPVRAFDCILVDNLHIAPIIAKKLRFWQRKKYVVHLGSHTLFFLYNGQYSTMVKRIHLWALRNYDMLICEGEMARELVQHLLPGYNKQIYVNFLGPKTERNNKLLQLEYNAASGLILIIANGSGEFRKYYKGIDLMIKAFGIAGTKNRNLKLEIVGHWDEEIRNQCLEPLAEEVRGRVLFTGTTDDIDQRIASASLLFHCTRGDAFPTSTIEAMAGGLPVLVSEWTGTKEMVIKADPKFVVEMNAEEMAERISWFYSLDLPQRKEYSEKFRNLAAPYTEENAIKQYQHIFSSIANER
ncbi:MAG: group 1 glycosyl transferase [Bacteroidetes bacterium]|jgi:glycosyltransferase involved in cell wall biosynthesis|nr:group 1 glycosyl transferase [Bacteroidota bacterium]